MSIRRCVSQHVYRPVHGFVAVALHYQHSYVFVEVA